jgi:O-acetylhomoserine (thiol)-lyase
MDVPDLAAAAEIAHRHCLPLMVDNTMATPYLCRPIELGADVVIHSTTKYLSGHGDAAGGAVIDSGNFDWNASGRFPDLKPFVDRKGPLAFMDKVWREHHINFGTTQAPLHSYLTIIGIDTLALRMERHMQNALAVAKYLQGRKELAWLNYPGLEESQSHETAKKQFGTKGYCGLMTFGLGDQETAFRFINHLKMIYHLANLGDCKSLIIHPYSSQYLSFDEPTRQKLSIHSDLLRLSVGIEDVEDICDDLGQALDSL